MADPRRRPQPPPPPPPPPSNEPDTNIIALDGTSDPEPTQDLSQNGQHPGQSPQPQPEGGFKLKFCTVCASNNNRSMEAHLRLTTAPNPYPTISFGTGSLVRLPGPSITQPNVYNFNSTSYSAMYEELLSKDARLYRLNGILPMLERNKGVKWGPERWQDWRIGVPRVGKRVWGEGQGEWDSDKGAKGAEGGVVDVVFTCEERCWDAVVDDLLSRGSPLNRPVHVFNVDIKDNHEEALVGGKAILELADALNAVAGEEREAWLSGEGKGSGEFDGGVGGARQGFDERVPEVLAEWQERWPQLPALWTLAWF
ncbi:RNA polymerase II subunit A C-terminal domain phosphatase ssu72 [Cryoendolithus antarcticus]|uniref:protein-serine/threonine phosphatase n=1 Tax=Cryoendolithus antarcticus TaxID=1507870 RepID=A0A1V8TUR0_9PEZI|nr:RNA polymerase II subunit A C-terminal domain phosphatase ssu72 [Cryoendolithus antarcticus]